MSLQTRQWHLAIDAPEIAQRDLLQCVREVAQFKADLLIALGDVRHFQPRGDADGPEDPRSPGPAVDRLQVLLREQSPHTALVGCSTAGEIIGRKVHSGTLVLTAVRIGSSRLVVRSLPIAEMDASAQAGEALSGLLAAAATDLGLPLRHLWMLAPGVHINGSALVEGLRRGFGSTTLPGISGGLAGDGGAFQRTWTVGPAGITVDHVVAVGLCGQSLISGSSADGGWEAFGPTRRVTSVDGNRLYEMDHEPALTIYRRYLGEYAKDLPASGLLFPLQITSGPDRGLIRTILGIDEARGGLILAGDVAPDAQVRLMHATTSSLVDAAEQAARRLNEQRHGEQALALLVSCVGRRIVMGDQAEEEVEAVCDELPAGTCVAGFYSNGEIAAWNFSGDCRLHNQTMTITWLSQSADSPPSDLSGP